MNQYLRIFLILSAVGCLTACHTLEENIGAQNNPPAVMNGPIKHDQPANEGTTDITSQQNSTPKTLPAPAPTTVTSTPSTPSTQSSNVIPVISQPAENQPAENQPSTSSDSGDVNKNNDSEVRSTPDTE